MDLIKIGKYIAGKRKALGLTQKQLAEKLGMSDKSVSKWERGVCLPDVSVYFDLCSILGISINEFLAGEDIAEENMVQKSEENIIGVTTDSKHKQKYLKAVICVLLLVSLAAVVFIGTMLFHKDVPQNFIAPMDEDSVEMNTVKMLSGLDGAFFYKYTTDDEFNSLKLFVSEYHSGELIDKQEMELGYESIGSPENGTILIVPDFNNFLVKLIIAGEGSKLSTEIPILSDVSEREYYGRSATQITEPVDINYDEEQPLVALIYDNNEMMVLTIQDLMSGETKALSVNDYVYYFSFMFCKEQTHKE